MRRKRSPFWSLFSIAIAGVIGVLAGYGALRLWKDDWLSVANQQTPVDRSATAPPTLRPDKTSTEPKSPTSPESARSRRGAMPATRSQNVESAPGVRGSTTSPEPLVPTPQPPPRPQHRVDLDLTRTTQQQILDVAPGSVRPAGIDGCDVPVEAKPDAIIIRGPRPITIAVSLTSTTSGKTRVSLEPTVTTDAGKEIPFTVRNMENYQRQVLQTGEAATNELAAMRAEQASLNAYVRSLIRKTTAEENAARARLAQLRTLIPIAERQVTALKADYAVAAKMLSLAETLDEKGQLVLEEIDLEERTKQE